MSAEDQYKRLQKDKKSLEDEWNTYHEKISFMRKALAIETDVTTKFKLETQLKEEDKKIKEITESLESIEKQLKLLLSQSKELHPIFLENKQINYELENSIKFNLFKNIIQTNHSRLRVLAGPGTGKTFSLIRRVARLIQDGICPSRILVCTFTRTAANDLKNEIYKLGVQGADTVYAGTLHGFCFSLLSKSIVLKLTGRVPRTLLKFEEKFLLEDIQNANFGGLRGCQKRLQAFNAAWARLYTEDPGWPTDSIDREFHQILKDWLYFHKAMLVGEVVPETLRYLRDNPASDERRAFDHILVDEYQDLNHAEQVLIELLAEAGTLTIIGDEDQSIYSFKYAYPEGITTFGNRHSNIQDERLQDCHRCPRIVIDMANYLISQNKNRMPRKIIPVNNSIAGEVYVVQWGSIEQEAEGIARFINKKVTNGDIKPGRILVLAPRRQFGYAIRDALTNINIQAYSFFSEEELDGNPKNILECQAQQAFTLLTLLTNPEDYVALRCWCGFGNNSLRKNIWNQFRIYCQQNSISLKEAQAQLLSGTFRIPRSEDFINRLKELETKLASLKNLRGLDLVDALFPGSEEWAEPFRSIASSIEDTDFDACKLREALWIKVAQPELPVDVDYVRIMSLHKSKGLTADLVVVIGCIEGLIPCISDNLSEHEKNISLEEQRRLFYVATTRSKRILVFSSVTQLPRKDAHKMRVPVITGNNTHANTIASQFLAETGPLKPNPVSGENFLRITESI
ncbi:DNA helicase II (plasmid) [Anabaenopsis circularis NIES-21]|uniref:DNA 3'-5' helicase n=1 Tax=Anabaenopsis circularis NIES-21 TaxID=1085406 RepID=A0A1Z4GSH4_9CYAN|nr:DNA helicase II [Anabaenopsis circularis NIES-21]